MKKILKNFLVGVVSIATIYLGVYAWDGLTASNGDTLTADTWNTLVNKVLPINSDGGNVGIGTTTPVKKLQVVTTSDTGAARFTSATEFNSTLEVETTVEGGEADITFLENGVEKGSLLNQNGDFEFWSKTSGTWQENMVLSGSGNLAVHGVISGTPTIFVGKGPNSQYTTPYPSGLGQAANWAEDLNIGGFTLQNSGKEIKVPSNGYYKINAIMHLKDDNNDSAWTLLHIDINGVQQVSSIAPYAGNMTGDDQGSEEWSTHNISTIAYLKTTDIVTVPYYGLRETQSQFNRFMLEKLN